MADAIVLVGTALLVLIALVGLIDVLRRLRDRRLLRDELSRLEADGRRGDDGETAPSDDDEARP